METFTRQQASKFFQPHIKSVMQIMGSRTSKHVSSSTWSDNKVHKLATVCLAWQHWTKALVWIDDDISAFHTRVVVVVDLWQSLSEWHLLLSACVLVCHRENVGA